MNQTTPEVPAILKSLPIADLEVVALCHVERDIEETIVETEVLNADLYDRSTPVGTQWKCHVCGHQLSYQCEVVHKPTLQRYAIGRDCAATIQTLAHYTGKLENISVALAQKAASRRRVNYWLTANPQHREIVAWAREAKNSIANDICRKLSQYGSLSEKQVAFLYRLQTQEAEKVAAAALEPQPTGPAPEGRLEVEVDVLGSKIVESDWGTQRKLLVRLAKYNTKAWLSCPSDVCLEKGDKAVLRATFQRSDTDQFFAFGSRPKFIK